jgi:hypothetical protein
LSSPDTRGKIFKRITTPTHPPVVKTQTCAASGADGEQQQQRTCATTLQHPRAPQLGISIYPTNLTPDKSQKCEATLSLSHSIWVMCYHNGRHV